MTQRALVRKQVGWFALAWTLITLVVAALTFFAIYVTYDTGAGDPYTANLALPAFTQEPQPTQVALVVTNPPTRAPLTTAVPSPEPTQDAPAVTEETGAALMSAQADTAAQAATEEAPPPLPTATLPPIEEDAFQVGIQVQYSLDLNPDNQDGWMRDVRDNLGLNWFKMQVRWEDVEPVQGTYDWSKVRLAVASARRNNMRMMISLVTAPEWARQPGVDTSKHGPPADYANYTRMLRRMLERWGDDIHAIEIWNEQNLDREWMSVNGLNAEDYTELLRVSYETIKSINPNIIVISGALSPGGGWQEPDGRISAIDDFAYLDGMISAGFLEYTDCVGVHHNGYNIGPSVLANEVPDDPTATFRGPFDNPHHSWSFRSTLETYADMVQVAGYDIPLCITEFGWASTEDLDGYPAGFEFANDNTLEEQATWMIEALENMEEWGFVRLAFIWNLNYGPQAGWDPTNDNVPYSLIGPDFIHRPAYDAVRDWSASRREAE